jgi:hypothetical protein
VEQVADADAEDPGIGHQVFGGEAPGTALMRRDIGRRDAKAGGDELTT